MAVAHKSAISVGLIHIPVGLYKTTKDISVNFNQLCKESGERIKYKKYCPSCDKEVKNEDIIKGYEFEKGKYVTISNDELEKIKSKKDKTIHILHFAKMSDIDPIYFEKDYYIAPEPGGEKPFELFRQALLSKKEVAVAKTVIGTKEELLVLYPTKTGIIAKLLFYQEEIQAVPVLQMKIDIAKEELEMAKTLIESMTKKFDPAAYHDEYQAKLREAIETKIKGQEIVSADSSAGNNVIDFLEALKKTVEQVEKGAS
ncbi:Ku protein [Clostridiales Family XIII bacterium ASD5510]|uniref:Non-homologous end joining protein Ku n=1 Tax=Hominibacterium faecale TaxID=2839743 RepID=A0A9J6QQ22_9FIRM|nr:Ku protein [Hominibacterium faecale]MCU7378098.1 Ku protein [Hominibacterium faecale]